MENQNENAVVKTARKVVVYSTVGKSVSQFDSTARIWSELQKYLKTYQVDLNNMKAVIGESKLTLESPNAVLPKEDFTLFLMPMKTKSGTELTYRECRTKIKEIIDSTPKDKKDSVKSFFSSGGRNYTQTSTDIMRKNLKKWEKKHSSTKSEKIAEVVKSTADKIKKSATNKSNAKTETIFTAAIDAVVSIDTKGFTTEETREWKTIITDLTKLQNVVLGRIEEEMKDEILRKDLREEALKIAKDFANLASF